MNIYIEKLQALVKHFEVAVANKNWKKAEEWLDSIADCANEARWDVQDQIKLFDAERYVAKHGIETGDTIVGYLHKHRPEVLTNMTDIVRDTVGYGRKASQLCKLQGLSPVSVAAPEGLQEAGIDHVRVYPIHVLEAVC